jgi:hypothetical protein
MVFLRYILTAVLLYFVYFETGLATTICCFLIFLRLELDAFGVYMKEKERNFVKEKMQQMKNRVAQGLRDGKISAAARAIDEAIKDDNK